MNIVIPASQVVVALTLPVLILWLEGRSRVVKTLSPVIVCYTLGIALGNLPGVDLNDQVSLAMCSATVALAIPLLLFSVDVVAWARLAKSTVISFCLCMVAAPLAGLLGHLVFRHDLAQSNIIAGMLTAVYIGCTPNMAAVGQGMNVVPETFILLNAADMVVSFSYLLFIFTLAPRLLKRVMRPFPRQEEEDDVGQQQKARFVFPSRAGFIACTGMALACVAAGAGLGPFIPEAARDAVVILVITTAAIAFSLSPRVRRIPGTQDMGQFLMLVFCVAMGFTTDFIKLFSTSASIIIYAAIAVAGTFIIHFILAWLFKIDRDTFIVTSVAGIFGPHLIGPTVVVLKNREVMVSGLASALVGIAAANYIGMALALLLA